MSYVAATGDSSCVELTMKELLTIAALLFGVATVACKQATPTMAIAERSLRQPSPVKAAPMLEPLFEGSPTNFRQTWKDFSKDGNYRMAQVTEVFSKPFQPFHYDWSNNVLVIVAAVSQTNATQFRLAYFKSPKTEQEKYKLFWVSHNHDLTKARISNASSDLVVYEDGGLTAKSSTLRWNSRTKQYTCLAK